MSQHVPQTSPTGNGWIATPRMEKAITTAIAAHGLAPRKGDAGFELTHALFVGLLVREFGFGEDAVIAAILHDTLEGTEVIRERFGDDVLAVVRDVSAPAGVKAWRERKAGYVEQLRRTPRDDARAVAAADKIQAGP